MKQSIDTLIFGLLFALVLISIGMSVQPMLRLARQLPVSRIESIQSTPKPPKLTGTPNPSAADHSARPASRLSS